MSLKNKTKVYMSLNQYLLHFVEERANVLGMKRAKYISDLLQKDFNQHQREKIIEGEKHENNYSKTSHIFVVNLLLKLY